MSLKTVQFSSGSSEQSSIASNLLHSADIIGEGLSLAVFFQLGDIQSLWHFLALGSLCRLNVQVQFADNKPVICPAVCTTHSLCHSDILSALFLYYDSRPWWLSWMRRPTGDQGVAGSTPAKVGNILL